MKTFKLVTLPGDGIGSEVVEGALRILEAACERHNIKLEISEHLFGGAAIDELGTPVTDETLEACRAADAVLLGAVGGAKWDRLTGADRPEPGLLRLRSALGVFPNIRPVTATPDGAHASSPTDEALSGVS